MLYANIGMTVTNTVLLIVTIVIFLRFLHNKKSYEFLLMGPPALLFVLNLANIFLNYHNLRGIELDYKKSSKTYIEERKKVIIFGILNSIMSLIAIIISIYIIHCEKQKR
jgi:hypothetical protein